MRNVIVQKVKVITLTVFLMLFPPTPLQPGGSESGEILPPRGDGRDRQRGDPLQDLPDQQLLRLPAVSAVQTGGCANFVRQSVNGIDMLTAMVFLSSLLHYITGSVFGRRAEQTTLRVPEEAGGHSDQQLQRPLRLGSDQDGFAVETFGSRSCFD